MIRVTANWVPSYGETVYQHSLFFERTSKKNEELAGEAEVWVRKIVEEIDETDLVEEKGEPIEFSFYTPEKVSDYNQGRIVQATSCDAHAFNNTVSSIP
jgi:hypothetical protein